MRIRRYQAASMQEVFRAIRADLGPEAVIISTRKVRGGVEVSAAIDYDAPIHNAPNYNASMTEGAAPRETAAAAADAGPSQTNGLRDLRFELAALRQIVLGAEALKSCPPRQAALYGWLTGRGLAPELALEVIAALPGGEPPAVPPQNEELSGLAEALSRFISVGGFSVPRGARKALALVGPTGVGKTTMVAKLSAMLLRAGRRVGLVSCDSYRIGAPDQIRSLARILQVPLGFCASARELPAALARRAECDVILIDTPGCSPYDPERLAEVAALAGAGQGAGRPVESHLVLSATTRDEELAAAVRAFEAAAFRSVIFTKLDEAERLGALVGAARRAQRPISWLGTGQGVPNDLEPADPGRVARFVLYREASEGDLKAWGRQQLGV
jgi:flagellar biosynthesis protein FlhF